MTRSDGTDDPDDGSPDYTPVDLSEHWNAALDALGDCGLHAGPNDLRGVPFRFGRDADRAIVLLGDRDPELDIAIGHPARTIAVLHGLAASDLALGGPIGRVVAKYAIGLDDGSWSTSSIREGLEITPTTPSALHFQELAHRTARTALAAHPAVEPFPGGNAHLPSQGLHVWTWIAPQGREITRLRIRPMRGGVAVFGVTAGRLDEDPFGRPRREPVVVRRPPGSRGDCPLQLEVTRGIATGVLPVLPTDIDSATAGSPGWGATDADPDAGYAEVSAAPSGRLRLKDGARTITETTWRAVIEAPPSAARPLIEWVDRRRAWVTTTVVDAATGQPIPCRLSFRSVNGIPWPPHGHPAQVAAGWHQDVGGDIRLGALTYAVIDGECQGWLTVGPVIVEAVRGFKYVPLRTVVDIQPGQRSLRLELRRWTDEFGQGWVSGDTHVHFLSVDGSHLEAAAEDLNVVNLLQAQWGETFTNTEDFTGRPSVRDGHSTIVWVGQENRQPVLGHLGLLGLRRPVMPWSADGPGEGLIADSLETTLSHWADAGHAAGGLVVVPHLGYPNGEAPVLFSTARADAAEMVWQSEFGHAEYYRYLDAGLRVPLVGGTDKMSNDVPVGIYRTYVQVDRDEPITFDRWADGIRAGRTYLSAGPVLRLEVDGVGIGGTVTVGRGGASVEIVASATSATSLGSLQVVAGGVVVAEAVARDGVTHLEIRERVSVEGPTWLALRSGGPAYFDAARTQDSFTRGIFAHTSPIYVRRHPAETDDPADAKAAEFVLSRTLAAREYVVRRALGTLGASGRIHQESDHAAYLTRPFDEAARELRRRSST